MDDIVSVSVFKHDHSLVDKRESETSESKKHSFDCGPTEDDYKTAEENSLDTSGDVFAEAETGSSSSGDETTNHSNPPLTLTMSIDPQLPSIQEDSTPTPDNNSDSFIPGNNSLEATVTKRRAISDAGVIPNDPDTASSNNSQSIDNSNVTDRPRAHSDLQPSTSLDSGAQQQKAGAFSRFSPSMTRRSFGRLGRTLSSRANSLKGTVTSGAQTVASGTQKVAHGVVTHTKSAANAVQSGIETGVKTVVAVPTSIVSVGSEILQEGQDLYGSFVAELKGEQPKSPIAMKREKSLATLESLRQKTHEARITSINQNNIDSVFSKATTNDEMQDLFQPIDTMTTSTTPIIGTPPDPPYYMTIRVDRKRMTKKKRINYEDALTSNRHASVSSTSDELSFGNRRRCEFWFAIPRTSADAIYHFLLIWSPGHHQPEEAENTTENNTSRNSLSQEPFAVAAASHNGIGNKKGLIVLNSNSDDSRIIAGDRIDEQNWFGATFGSGLAREWEIITVRELCRRLSLDQEYDLAEIPLPEGSIQSQILDEFMIRQIAEILPPRAEGYPWVLIYNSEKHGYSLSTLYRKMETWYEEMSPILLIIRDTQGHVFGAMVSTAIRPAEHYYGTADSCFLFRFTGKVPHTRELRHYEWTGDNQFFIHSTRNTLSIGAGQGHSGLWLDADLNHGRSQRCKTFDNEPLAGGDEEDFIIQFVEAFGFSMN
jgi:hypothetical protein